MGVLHFESYFRVVLRRYTNRVRSTILNFRGQPQNRLVQSCVWQILVEGTMEGGYATWMGQPVILRVVAGNLRVPLRGRLVSETTDVLRVRIAENWDVDIFKSMVAAIEHDLPVAVVH